MYKDWYVGDKIKICVKVEDACFSPTDKFLFLNYQRTESGDIIKGNGTSECNIFCERPNCSYKCINTSNREVTFYTVSGYKLGGNGGYCPQFHAFVDNPVNKMKIYHELGKAITNDKGIAILNYTVTKQDVYDYNDAIVNGYPPTYSVVCCLSNIAPELVYSYNYSFKDITVTPKDITPTFNTNILYIGIGIFIIALILKFNKKNNITKL